MSEIDTSETLGLRVVRELPATPAQVFEAYTDPEAQKIWLSALGAEKGEVETSVDLHVGGVWEATFRANPAALVHDVQTYLEIHPPHRLITRLVSESSIGGQPMPAITGQITVSLAASAVGTILTAEQTGLPNAEVRDFFETVAWAGALDRIEAYLANRN